MSGGGAVLGPGGRHVAPRGEASGDFVLPLPDGAAKIAAVEISILSTGSALLAGLLFGYCAQRGGFCLTRALSNWVLMGDTAILRAYVLALLVAIVGVHVLELGLVESIPVRPFRWLANITGGFVFGVGMILGGGCAGSSWYRLGEGALGAWVVLAGFAMGASAASVGILQSVRTTLQTFEYAIDDQPATLHGILGVRPWLVIGVLVAGLGVWLVRNRPEEGEHGKWRWPVTGVAIGVVIVLGWYLSTLGGTPTGITFAANTGHLLTYPTVGYPNRVTWGMTLILGVVAGGGAGRVASRGVRLEARAGLHAREAVRGRARHGRRGAGRRRVQCHPGPHELRDARARQPDGVRFHARRRLGGPLGAVLSEGVTGDWEPRAPPAPVAAAETAERAAIPSIAGSRSTPPGPRSSRRRACR